MTDVVGYCALMVPDQNFWQGYFIPGGLDTQAEVMLTKIRGLIQKNPGPPPLTLLPFGGLNPVDQHVLGAIGSAWLGAIQTHGATAPVIGVAITSIMKLTGCRFFYVVAHEQAEGTTTNFNRIDVTTVDEAKAFLQALPLVTAIEVNFSKGKTRQ